MERTVRSPEAIEEAIEEEIEEEMAVAELLCDIEEHGPKWFKREA